MERVAPYRLTARFAARKRVLDGVTGLARGATILARAGAAEVTGIDNDIEVREGLRAVLLTEMEADARLAACCCRFAFPDGTVQFTGGGMRVGSLRVRFDLLQTGRREEDLTSHAKVACDWVPGGETIFCKAVFDAMPYDTSLEAGDEDSERSITARRTRHALGYVPLATVIRHLELYHVEQRDAHSVFQRYDNAKCERTPIHIHEKHGLFIDEEDLYRHLGYPNSEAFIERTLPGSGGRA